MASDLPTNGWSLNITNAVTRALSFAVQHASSHLEYVTATNAITFNQWNHVIVTWDGSLTAATGVRIYVNNVQQSTSFTGNGVGARTSDAAADLLIGNNPANSRTFDGLIDEVHVFNRVLTASERNDLYTQVSGANCFSCGTDPNLVGHWKMNENSGTTAANTVNAVTNGAFVATPTWTTGKIGSALQFNGTTQAVNIPYNSSLDLTSNLTISAWVYPTSLAGSIRRIFTLPADEVSGNEKYSLFLASGAPRFLIGGTSSDYNVLAPSALTINAWSHVAGVLEDNTFTIYVNGVAVNSATYAYGAVRARTAGNAAIGRWGPTAAWNAQYFPGRIDDVRLYSRALSAAEIGMLYNNNGGCDQ